MNGGIPLTAERIAQLRREADARGECVFLLLDGGSVPASRYQVPWHGRPWHSALRTADIAYAVWPEGWRYRGRFWRRAELVAAKGSAREAAAR
jgi:hypothetical protein